LVQISKTLDARSTIGGLSIATSHASSITSGTFSISRLPVGSSSNDVAAGDHGHQVPAPVTYRLVTDSTTIPKGMITSVDLFCNEEDLVLSGGYSSNAGLVLLRTGPMPSLNGWSASYDNPSEFDTVAFVEILCLEQ